MKKKKLTSLIVLVFVLLCNCDYFKSLCEPENAPKKQPTTLQNIVNKATDGEIINLEEWENITDYTATIDKKLTIKSGNLNGASLTVKAENVKLEKMQNLSVETSSRLTIKDSKLNNLLLGGNAQSRSNTTAEINVILENCEIAEKIKINSQAKLNITGKKTKIAKIVVAVVETLCKIFCAEELDTTEIKDIIVDEDNKKLEDVKVSKAYKIIYHSNCDELEDIEDFFSPDDGTISLPTDIFNRDGYIFADWYKDEACKQIFDNFDVSDKTADIHVYAEWESKFYSYELEIKNLVFEWGGGFSVLLLTDEQLEVCKDAKDFKQATAEKPEYQIAAFGDMIVDTTKEGNFAVYGRNGSKYDGVAVTIKDNTFTLFIDMTKLTKTQLKGLWKDTGNGDEAFITEDDTVNLTGYKPYVIALTTQDKDENIFQFRAETWNADLMKMTGNATFPTDLQQSPPTTGNTNSVTVTNISVNSTNHKTSYYIGEEFDLTELTIKVEKSDGTTETISVTSEMITGFDSSTAGTKTLTITYGGCTTTFNIEVKELTATADDVGTVIAGLSAGTYTLKVTGEITSDTITEIVTAMTNNTTPQINLDLSGTTGLTEIPEFAFCRSDTFEGYSNLLSITIPNSVTTIGDHAFHGCSNLTSVIIPDDVTSIRTDAFSNCVSLTSINIPDKVESIGDYAFINCINLTNFKVDTNNQYYSSLQNEEILCSKDQKTLIAYPSAKDNVTIPNGITIIGDNAFHFCPNLKSIEIPDSVTTIEYQAFYSCGNLTSVTIGNGVTSIGKSVFADCSNLTNITIGNKVTTIGDNAFYNCSSLTSVTIPSNVTTIGGYVFYCCSNLTNITINNGVTTIGDQAFHSCSSLTSITIPDSVESIGSFSFVGCNNLTTFEVGTNNSNFSSSNDKHILFNKDKTELIAYPSATEDITTIPDSNNVTTIKSGAFEACSGLTSLTIPDSVISIEFRAIAACTNLKTVIIGSGVKTIYNNVFESCSSLENVTFKDTNNWYYTSNSDFTGGEEIVETDTKENSNKFKENDKYWYKSSASGTTE